VGHPLPVTPKRTAHHMLEISRHFQNGANGSPGDLRFASHISHKFRPGRTIVRLFIVAFASAFRIHMAPSPTMLFDLELGAGPENPFPAERTGHASPIRVAPTSARHEVYWFANSFPGCLPEETIDAFHLIPRRQGSSVTKRSSGIAGHSPSPRHGPSSRLPWYARGGGRTHCIAYIHGSAGARLDAFYPWPMK